MALPTAPTADRWCSTDLLELYAGTQDPTDADNAIGWATWSIANAVTCSPEIDEDPPPNYPIDVRFQQATAIMAAGILTAGPIDVGTGGGDQVTSETLGSYRYTVAEPVGSDMATAMDPAAIPAVVDLIGWCLGATAAGAYELTTSPSDADYVDGNWDGYTDF